MANEIRVLEDQLYEADYHNRVLRDELNRLKSSQCETPSPSADSDIVLEEPIHEYAPSAEVPLAVPTPEPPTSLDLDNPYLEESMVPAIPGMETISDQPTPLSDPNLEAVPAPEPDAIRESIPAPEPDASSNEVPGPVEPPTPEEIAIPPVEESDSLLPPPADKADEKDDSSKINISPDTNVLKYELPKPRPAPEPVAITLHPSLSGGHQFDADDEIDGLYLIVTVVDKGGEVLSLDQFDVDAEMSVVVMDQSDKAGEQRLGRWDFTSEQVRSFVRSSPIDGLHIPIPWKDREPESNTVTVHVRMAAAEEEMRCQAKLRLEESVAMSNWLPRG